MAVSNQPVEAGSSAPRVGHVRLAERLALGLVAAAIQSSLNAAFTAALAPNPASWM
jgi:hypothetical protein